MQSRSSKLPVAGVQTYRLNRRYTLHVTSMFACEDCGDTFDNVMHARFHDVNTCQARTTIPVRSDNHFQTTTQPVDNFPPANDEGIDEDFVLGVPPSKRTHYSYLLPHAL